MQKSQRRIANIRNGALRQLTTDLFDHFDLIALEDLNRAGMLRDLKLSRAITDTGLPRKMVLLDPLLNDVQTGITPSERSELRWKKST